MVALRSERGRRVVVTGVGLASALGLGRRDNWRAALAGTPGARRITRFDASAHACRIACEVDDLVPEDYMNRKAARRMDRVSQLAVAAARMAVDDAGVPDSLLGERAGAVIASGNGGNETYEQGWRTLVDRGPDRVLPTMLPAAIVNMAAGMVSVEIGLGGPVSTHVTACASGTHALGEALETMRRGEADLMLAGGSEAGITPFTMAALDATRALSRHNEDPAGASRPFDRSRDGFVAAEGAGVLVLEDLERALERGAEPLCELTGYGASSDAYHLTDPDPSGARQTAAVLAALADAGIAPDELDYVNAHGTSTLAGDGIEIQSLRAALGDAGAGRVAVSSTKSMHGHAMGAAGGIEGALTALAIHDGMLPPTINLVDLDPQCAGVDHVTGQARAAAIRTAISSSFGFGGHNAVIAMTAVS